MPINMSTRNLKQSKIKTSKHLTVHFGDTLDLFSETPLEQSFFLSQEATLPLVHSAKESFGVTIKSSWSSSVFALFTDLALSLLGGTLKAKGQLSGRFADVFSWMYIAQSALRRFDEEGQRKEDLPLLLGLLIEAFYEIKEAFDGILENFEHPIFRYIVAPVFKFLFAINQLVMLLEMSMT